MNQIERKDYMNPLIGLRDKNLIKVLTGVRRCGKSTVGDKNNLDFGHNLGN